MISNIPCPSLTNSAFSKIPKTYIYPLHQGRHTPASCSFCGLTPYVCPQSSCPPISPVLNCSICSKGHAFYTRLMIRCMLKTGEADFTIRAALVPRPATIVKHVCRYHKLPMSLWLSGPTTSLSDIQLSLLQRLPFPSKSITLILFWTFFITSVVILLLAIRNIHCASRASRDASAVALKFRSQRFGPANWEDEEKAGMLAKERYITIRI